MQSIGIKEPRTHKIKLDAPQALKAKKKQNIAPLQICIKVQKEWQKKTKEIVNDMDNDDA